MLNVQLEEKKWLNYQLQLDDCKNYKLIII